MSKWQRWTPAIVLGLGALLMQSVRAQRRMPLTTPLSTIPAEFEGRKGYEVPIGEEERRVAGMDTYISRVYIRDTTDQFSLYVGYYESQSQGRTIHSPRNCLPGAGWEPIESRIEQLETSLGAVPVNRYLLGNGPARAIVYYWYQGRGRVSANEYRVKFELVRDAALRRRTDEALVRIVVPVGDSEVAADSLALRVAREMVPTIARILPS
jgi:EpsI family protein